MAAADDRPKAHYLPLDSVRGIAALTVVVHHFAISETFRRVFPHMGPADVPFFHNGWVFVDLFFVLSGLVIALNYGRPGVAAFSFKDFMVRRLARIYPLHIVMLCVFLLFRLTKLGLVGAGVLHVVPGETEVNDLYTFVMNVLLLHALGFTDHLSWNGPSWSISAEFYTYMLFGLVLVLAAAVRSARMFYVAAAFISAASLFLILAVLKRPTFDFHFAFGILRCTYSFFIGVLTLKAVSYLPRWVPQRLRTIAQWGTFALAGLVVAFIGDAPVFSALAPFVFASLLGLLMAFPAHSLPRVLSVSPLVWLGKRSYSIYMTHALVVVLAEYAVRAVGGPRIAALDAALPGVPATATAALIVIAVLMLSNVTYNYVELPGSKFLRRLLSRREATISPALAAERGAKG